MIYCYVHIPGHLTRKVRQLLIDLKDFCGHRIKTFCENRVGLKVRKEHRAHSTNIGISASLSDLKVLPHLSGAKRSV